MENHGWTWKIMECYKPVSRNFVFLSSKLTSSNNMMKIQYVFLCSEYGCIALQHDGTTLCFSFFQSMAALFATHVLFPLLLSIEYGCIACIIPMSSLFLPLLQNVAALYATY